MSLEIKVCTKCGERKTVEEFGMDRGRRRPECKECHRAYNKKYSIKKREQWLFLYGFSLLVTILLMKWQCRRCLIEKDINEFAIDRGRILSLCRMCHAERTKAYRKAHPDRTKVTERHSYLRKYATHRQEILMRNSQWDRNNPDKRNIRASRYRARKASAETHDLTPEQWEFIKQSFRHRCAYCGKKPKVLTQDHITPIFHKGCHTAQNIVPSCQSCNSKKNTGPPLKPVQPVLGLK